MKRLTELFKGSARELKQASTLSVAGMLAALSVILAFFTITLSQVMRVSFSFLPIAAGGMLFGPVTAGAIAAVSDVAGYLIHPTGPFFPGFTMSAMLAGLIYGVFLYHKPVTLLRTAMVTLLVTVLVHWVLNSLWLNMLYGNGFFALMATRVLKNMITFPVDTALLYTVLKVAEKIGFVSGTKGKELL